MVSQELIALPEGYERFHRQGYLNYQFNRAHALGFADRRELAEAAGRIRSAAECAAVFEDLSAQAAADGRLRHAAGYLRLAEFFTPPRSTAKAERYRRLQELYEATFAGTGVERLQVPYGEASLPAYYLPAAPRPADRRPAAGAASQGAVLLHGGFDSVIEEFHAVWQRIAAAGFDVIAFEGPGQGGARAVHGLTSDHAWEKPVGAVLDHVGLGHAALVGLSMGGYWALRAAGREPRIHRVVAWPPVYDWLYRLPPSVRGPVRSMLGHRHLMRWSVRARARVFPTLRAVVEQVLYMVDSDDPADVVDWFLGMNADHLGSERVRQDVLLLCGEHDAFQPPVLARAQARALTSARSLTVRTFTAAEHADQHCQMGNLELACRVLTDWLQDPQPSGTPNA